MLLIVISSVFPYFEGKEACVRANRVAKTQAKCPLFCLRRPNCHFVVGSLRGLWLLNSRPSRAYAMFFFSFVLQASGPQSPLAHSPT